MDAEGAALTLKKLPRLAMLRPTLDLEAGVERALENLCIRTLCGCAMMIIVTGYLVPRVSWPMVRACTVAC